VSDICLVSPVDEGHIGLPTAHAFNNEIWHTSVEEVSGATTTKAVPRIEAAIEAEIRHASLNGSAKKIGGDRDRPIESDGRGGGKKGVEGSRSVWGTRHTAKAGEHNAIGARPETVEIKPPAQQVDCTVGAVISGDGDELSGPGAIPLAAT
jgi:hypothetical protein